jgi:shikimate dehydrogenase
MSAAVMDRYAVVGNPVAHSRSPFIHARFAAATGEPLSYERIESPLAGFAATVRRFAAAGGRGCNVTVPFKAEAFALAARTSGRAALARVVNTLRFDAEGWFGDNSVGVGLVRDIVGNAATPIAQRRVLLVGAGGAAAGVLGALIEERPAFLRVANRSADKARALVRSHAALARAHGVALSAASLDAADSGFEIVVNATSSSLHGAPPPVAASALARGALALDMMYGPAAAGFLDWAREHGALARDGLGMLVEQAAESFHVWRGRRPETAPVLAALREQLARTPA